MYIRSINGLQLNCSRYKLCVYTFLSHIDLEERLKAWYIFIKCYNTQFTNQRLISNISRAIQLSSSVEYDKQHSNAHVVQCCVVCHNYSTDDESCVCFETLDNIYL